MSKTGFTLVELLAVVMILAVLTAVAVPQYRRSADRARVAEVQQMLPAIFDARERLIIETGNSWHNANWTSGLPNFARGQNPAVTFGRLDITMKGHRVNADVLQWETPNFTYNLFDSAASENGNREHVSAVWRSNQRLSRLGGTTFYYDGNGLTCCPPTGGTEPNTEACEHLNVPRAGRCAN